MKSHLWRLATVGLLCVSVSGQVLADERGDGGPQEARPNGGQHGGQAQGGNNQQRPEHSQGRPEGGQGNQPRVERGQPNESRGQPQNGQWQGRPHQEFNGQQGHPAQPGNQQHVEGRPPQAIAPQPGNNLQIQPRPNAVQQTQAPNRGGNQNWQQGGGSNSRPGFNPAGPAHPNDVRWTGRPDGHGNGWGPGPQYRPVCKKGAQGGKRAAPIRQSIVYNILPAVKSVCVRVPREAAFVKKHGLPHIFRVFNETIL